MKYLFYSGLLLLAIFELFKVYFIMPMPGSQETVGLEPAYFLHSWRWIFRIFFLLIIIIGGVYAFKGKKKWLPVLAIIPVIAFVYLLNFKMHADIMFKEPKQLVLSTIENNKVDGTSLIIGIEKNGEAKAYPIKFLTYHHIIKDNIGSVPVIITYCSVCHSGRAFSPIVNGKIETFRLVGMDHYNAMLEDATTKSWWRQENGEAVTGKLKGTILPEIEAVQMTLNKWFELYPKSKVMQADEFSINKYDLSGKFEEGKSKDRLTGTDSLSWKDKSLVIGIRLGNVYKAYDWNELKKKKIINDIIGRKKIVLALSEDKKSFMVLENTTEKDFTISGDTLFSGNQAFDFSGKNLATPSEKLPVIQSYQEFWHSWKFFHPETFVYNH